MDRDLADTLAGAVKDLRELVSEPMVHNIRSMSRADLEALMEFLDQAQSMMGQVRVQVVIGLNTLQHERG